MGIAEQAHPVAAPAQRAEHAAHIDLGALGAREGEGRDLEDVQRLLEELAHR
jgi:hypothetical protein